MGGEQSREASVLKRLGEIEQSPDAWGDPVREFLEVFSADRAFPFGKKHACDVILSAVKLQHQKDVRKVRPLLQVLQRMLFWEEMYEQARKVDWSIVLECAACKYTDVVQESVRTLMRILRKAGPGDEGNEKANKQTLLGDGEAFGTRVVNTITYVVKTFGALDSQSSIDVVCDALDLANALLCERIHTTPAAFVAQLTNALVAVCPLVIGLTAPPVPLALRGKATDLVQSLILEGSFSVAATVQQSALSNAALLWHLAYSVAVPTTRRPAASARMSMRRPSVAMRSVSSAASTPPAARPQASASAHRAPPPEPASKKSAASTVKSADTSVSSKSPASASAAPHASPSKAERKSPAPAPGPSPSPTPAPAPAPATPVAAQEHGEASQPEEHAVAGTPGADAAAGDAAPAAEADGASEAGAGAAASADADAGAAAPSAEHHHVRIQEDEAGPGEGGARGERSASASSDDSLALPTGGAHASASPAGSAAAPLARALSFTASPDLVVPAHLDIRVPAATANAKTADELQTMLTLRNRSRLLVALLCDDSPANRTVLERLLPAPIIARMQTTAAAVRDTHGAPVEDEKAVEKLPMAHVKGKSEKKIVAEQFKNRRTPRFRLEEMWKAYDADAENETLIWNATTRSELCLAIDEELMSYLASDAPRNGIEWPWQQFAVEYQSLRGELRAGPFYLRLLLPRLDVGYQLADPRLLLRQLYDASVIEDEPLRKTQALAVMARLIRVMTTQVADAVPVRYLAWLLRPRHYNEHVTSAVLEALRVLISAVPAAARPLVDAHGLFSLAYHAERSCSRTLASESAKEAQALLHSCCAQPRIRHQVFSPVLLPHISRVLLSHMEDAVKLAAMTLLENLPLEPAILPFVSECSVIECALIALLRFPHCSSSISSTESPDRSYLDVYLPPQLVAILDDDFAKFADSFHKDFRRAMIYWEGSMRKRLSDHLVALLRDVTQQLDEDPHAEIEWPERQPVVYPEIDALLLVDGVYVQFYVDDVASRLARAAVFAQMCCERLARKGDDAPDEATSVLLISAVLAAVERQADDFRSVDAAAQRGIVMAVVAAASAEQSSPAVRAAAMRCVAALASSTLANAVLDSDAVALCAALISDHGTEPVHLDALRTLHALLANEGVSAGARARVWQSGSDLVTHLVLYTAPTAVTAAPDFGKAALRVLPQVFACYNDASAIEAAVSAGGVLWALHLALTTSEPVTAELATTAVTTMLRTGSKAVREHAQRVLPKFMVHDLQSSANAGAAIQLLVRDACTPVVIWDASMRAELLAAVKAAEEGVCKRLGEALADVQVVYGALKNEIEVADVYLKTLLAQPTFKLLQAPNVAVAVAQAAVADGVAPAKLLVMCKVLVLLAAQSAVTAQLSQQRADIAALANTMAAHATDANPELLVALLAVLTAVTVSSDVATCILPAQGGESALALARLVHSPKTTPAVTKQLLLLSCALASYSSDAVLWLWEKAVVLKALDVLCVTTNEKDLRVGAARLVGTVCTDQRHGKDGLAALLALLSPSFQREVQQARANAEALVKLYDEDTETPLMVWTDGCRRDLSQWVVRELVAVEQQMTTAEATFRWSWRDIHTRYASRTLAELVKVGDVYLEQFCKQIHFAGVQHDRFVLNLCAAVGPVLDMSVDEGVAEGDRANARSHLMQMWDAMCALLHATQKLVTKIASSADTVNDVTGAVMRHFTRGVDADSVLQPMLRAVDLLCAADAIAVELIKHKILAYLVRVVHNHPKLRGDALNVVLTLVKQQADAVAQFAAAGGVVVVVLMLLLQGVDREVRLRAVEVLCNSSMRQPVGDGVRAYVEAILMPEHAKALSRSSTAWLEVFDGTSTSDKGSWNAEKRDELRAYLGRIVPEMFSYHDPALWNGTQAMCRVDAFDAFYHKLGVAEADAVEPADADADAAGGDAPAAAAPAADADADAPAAPAAAADDAPAPAAD